MINVDISNIWCRASLPDLLALEADIAASHAALDEMDWPGRQFRAAQNADLGPILAAAERIREESDVLVVIGDGGEWLSSQAAIELLQGPNRNYGREKGDPWILYTGSSLSARHHQEILRQLEGKDFSLCILAEPGDSIASGLTFRNLRWILERKYGTDEARRRIYAATAEEDCVLAQMAREEDWELFLDPAETACGVLSAGALLPMAVAGIDISRLLRGIREAEEAFRLRSFENPVWLYAAIRNLMRRSGMALELLVVFEPGFRALGAWWQRLFGMAGSGCHKGLFPAVTGSSGNVMVPGRSDLFETMVHFDPPEQSPDVIGDVADRDGLNYLEGKSLSQVEATVFPEVAGYHADNGVPVITVDCGPLNAATLGELFCFFQLACAISTFAPNSGLACFHANPADSEQTSEALEAGES